MSDKMIQQQLYTRERGGIFHGTDGYDTIAISPNLDKAFVKKYLHPICIYHSPNSLRVSGEKDSLLYPAAVTIIQPETGDLVVGQSVFIPADFTGQRSTFFMHNYVIPTGLKEDWVLRPEKLFGIDQFRTSYDVQLGQELPELSDIPNRGNQLVLEKSTEILGKLGMTEEIFKMLLFAVMSSISGKKKVFITLDVALSDYSRVSLQLLEVLYRFLPYSYRRKLGAMTYSNEAEGKKYIHVMFVEPGGINYQDRVLEKQYIFDLASGRISGVDLGGFKHEYLEFAWSHLIESKSMDEFFVFAEKALLGLDEVAQLDMASYYSLTDIYLTIQGGGLNYFSKNKIAFLGGLLKFLQYEQDKKPELVELFLRVVREVKLAGEADITLDFIRSVNQFNKIVIDNECFLFILRTLNHYKNDHLFYEIWHTVEQDQFTFNKLINILNLNPSLENFLTPYLVDKFRSLKQLEEILAEIDRLILNSSYLLKNRSFITITTRKVAEAVESADNAFDATLMVRRFGTEFKSNEEFYTYKEELRVGAERALLKVMRLEEVSRQDIDNFGKIFLSGSSFLVNDLGNGDEKDQYMTMEALYTLFTSSGIDDHSLFDLNARNRVVLQDVLKRLLQEILSPQYFLLLLIAFQKDFNQSYRYDKLFDYLDNHGKNKAILSFIKWVEQQRQLDKEYYSALKEFLTQNKDPIWKDRSFRKALKKIPSDKLQRVIKRVKRENAHPVARFFMKNGFPILLISLALGLTAGLVWFFFFK